MARNFAAALVKRRFNHLMERALIKIQGTTFTVTKLLPWLAVGGIALNLFAAHIALQNSKRSFSNAEDSERAKQYARRLDLAGRVALAVMAILYLLTPSDK